MKKLLSILIAVALLITPMTGLQESYAISFDFIYAYEDKTVSESEVFELAVRLTSCNATLNSLTLANVRSSLSGFTIKGVRAGSLVQGANVSYESDFDSITLSNINVSATGSLVILTVQAPSKAGSYEIYPYIGDQTYSNSSYYGTNYTASAIITVKSGGTASNNKTVTFNANSGSGGPGAMSAAAGSTITIPNSSPTKSGYVFQGWAEGSQSSEATYKIGDKITLNRDYVLYAVWKSDGKATLYYNANGKSLTSGLPDSASFIKGNSVTISSVRPVATGYNFLGWSTSSSATKAEYTPGNSYVFNENTTLYAVWSLATYTIFYDANGGQGAPDSQTKKYGTDIKLSTTVPTRANYSFAGWATSKYATSYQYGSGAVYTNNESITLYAVWADKTYAISYSANGGSNAPGAQYKTHGVNLAITYEQPTRSGYTFLGWSTNKGATSPEYYSGSTFTTDAITTLYAIWKRNIYTVTYDANGGSGAPASQTKEYTETITLSSDKPTREGYYFKGWTDTPDGEVIFKAGASFARNADTTLYAVWKKKVYTITYDANGGENAPGVHSKDYGQDVNLSTNIPTRTGYNFTGWATSSTGSVKYTAGAVYSSNASVTLYAVWKLKTYEVKFNPNGGTGATATQTKKFGTDLTIKTTKPTRTGYVFQGWATSSNGSVVYLPGATYSKNETITLFAVWNIKTYTVSFNANGGSGAPDSQTKTYGTALTLTTAVPTRTGYNFLGWSKDSTATEPTYYAGGTYNVNAGYTLYAVWERKTYTVKFNPNGGTGATASQTKTYGIAITIKTTKPTRTGYNFLGWATTSKGEVKYLPGETYKTLSSYTLYAVWEPKTYTVKFDPNGGSGATATQTKTYGKSITIKTTKPTRTGYKFLGWAASATGEVKYLPGETYKTLSSYTLYAVWELKTYTVKFNANGGTGAPASQTKTYGETLVLSSKKPTRTGYTFVGWAKESTATTVNYYAGGKYTVNAGYTLYAVWKKA